MNTSLYRRCATCVLRTRISAIRLSSAAESTVLNRDVFIYDPLFSMESWVTSHRIGLSAKHPSSGHVIATYSSYLHNNSKYHFNSLGEFSLIFTSVIPLPCTSALDASKNSNSDDLALTDKRHTILIHPDKLCISGLSVNEVPTVVDLILQDKVISVDALRGKLPHGCVITEAPKLIIIASASKNRSVDSVIQVLNWFRSAIEENDDKKKYDYAVSKAGDKIAWPSPSLLLASDLGGHRNSSSVLILPSEDSFEFVSNEKTARSIIKSLYSVKPSND